MVPVEGNETQVRIYMENTGQIAQARVQTPDGQCVICRRGHD